MEIKGKIHCFFEQSGTFKNEFKKLGFEAYDYDIQNNFGETDFVIDLFKEIENGYNGNPSIFDGLTKDDLIIAFFPCIYFCAISQMYMYYSSRNYQCLSKREINDAIIDRSKKREKYFRLAVQMLGLCRENELRIIMENPWSEQTFLKSNFVMYPSYIDMDRTKRGDFFKKPTAFWFINCDPEKGYTIMRTPKNKIKTFMSSKGSKIAGICSEERSMISSDYARNFICDNILGITQKRPNIQLSLF